MEHANIQYQMKNLERKIEIANLAFQKAKKIMNVKEYPKYVPDTKTTVQKTF